MFLFLFSCKSLILELLAAVCLVELGHDVVLAAFDYFRIVKDFHRKKKIVFLNFFYDFSKICVERFRFETLMKSFTEPAEFNVDYMVSPVNRVINNYSTENCSNQIKTIFNS